MRDVSMVVDASTIRIRGQSPAVGDICLSIGGREFPSPGWNDFVVVILGWWMAALLRLVREETRSELVNFMEGPYAVELAKSLDGILRLRALEGSERARERMAGETPLSVFVADMVSLSKLVLGECRRLGRWTAEEEDLQSLLVCLEIECAR